MAGTHPLTRCSLVGLDFNSKQATQVDIDLEMCCDEPKEDRGFRDQPNPERFLPDGLFARLRRTHNTGKGAKRETRTWAASFASQDIRMMDLVTVAMAKGQNSPVLVQLLVPHRLDLQTDQIDEVLGDLGPGQTALVAQDQVASGGVAGHGGDAADRRGGQGVAGWYEHAQVGAVTMGYRVVVTVPRPVELVGKGLYVDAVGIIRRSLDILPHHDR